MPSFDSALKLFKSGKLHDALTEATALLASTPGCIELLNLVAETHAALNEPAAAADYLRRVTALRPGDAAAHRRLAIAEGNAGQRAASIASYRRAIELEPGNALAHNNLGRALEEDGDLPGATASYQAAIAADTSYAIAHVNLGNLLLQLGMHGEALECFQRAGALRPDVGQAWLGCATVLLGLKRAAEALSCSDHAVRLLPTLADAWLTRGAVLDELQRPEEALACCDRALALRPGYLEAIYARANLLRRAGDRDSAVAGFRAALRLKPDYQGARIAAVIAEIPALPATSAEIEASQTAFEGALAGLGAQLRAQPCGDPTALVGVLQPFYLAYRERNQREVLRTYGTLCADLMSTWQHRPPPVPVGGGRPAGAKLRVGFVSAQIRDHSVYNVITRGWLRHLDRRRFAVEVFHLGSGTDTETEAARSLADHFEQGQRTTREWTAAIGERRPDVLIYPEIGMDRTTLQLASMRLARVQLASWGHPMTTGLPTIDHFVSAEAFEPPDGQQHYTERLLRLPNLGVCYQAPRYGGDLARREPRSANPGAVFICAGTPFKYAPEHDAVLVQIARRLGRCQFNFFRFQDGVLSRRLLSRLHGAFSAAGLDGAAHLVLRPWARPAQFRELLGSADALLDTIGFSGFNTVMQALECGLPVVTCRGRFMRGRLGSGILERLSLPDLVAENPEAYADIAVSLAESPAARSRLHDQLQLRLPLAYEDRAGVEKLQEFLLRVAS